MVVLSRALQRLRRRVFLPRSPFLWVVVIAAFVEVVHHASKYHVPTPARELDAPFYTSCQEPVTDGPRENAAIVMLARNEEVDKAKRSVESLERRFNQWFKYPIVFLNDEPWSDEFIATLKAATSALTSFELIPKDAWLFPSYIDQNDARQSIKKQGDAGILYAGKETYHHMCRFFSGYFYQVEALKKYKWYWRLEPDVEFSCSITYDPFVEMARHDKVYGFTISLPEEKRTCPSLFRKVADWKEAQSIPSTNLWKASIDASWVPWPFRDYLSWFSHRDSHGDGWNLCHYWSNFEIADLDFFRDEHYQDLYRKLEHDGGFYYERWGDAAVHSLAVNMLAEPHQVHHFADFGYRHDWYYQCPANAPEGQMPESQTLNSVKETWKGEMSGGVGCRCDCDGRKNRNHGSYCLNKLKAPNTARRPWSTWMLSWVL
ncbi:Uu.00g051160.m01.CDS01 [Anthostomella pinea]|uniref:Uu.00g051160.m01.CDS01 n=1 Tax=Anthostomella pinea TaxID=933095 RepID=A0AAI8YMK9_9PEZI|nr:Uu.00g051160.m01.CDS01 [Anthostomella pinea]